MKSAFCECHPGRASLGAQCEVCGRVVPATPEYMGQTIFAPFRKYRYTLARSVSQNGPGGWSNGLFPSVLDAGAFVMFVGLNPSKADETRNDNTVSKCIGFAHKWGFRGMVMCNLHALVSTDPAGLYAEEDSQGPDNLAWIMAVARKAWLIVCCWGNHGEHLGRGVHVADCLVSEFPGKVATLAHTLHGFTVTPIITKRGHPGHPCRLSSNLTYKPWKGYERP